MKLISVLIILSFSLNALAASMHEGTSKYQTGATNTLTKEARDRALGSLINKLYEENCNTSAESFDVTDVDYGYHKDGPEYVSLYVTGICK